MCYIKGMTKACRRCGGKGKVAGFEHVFDGVCYSCRGSGVRGGHPTAPKMVACACSRCGRTESAPASSFGALPVGWGALRERGVRTLTCNECRELAKIGVGFGF